MKGKVAFAILFSLLFVAIPIYAWLLGSPDEVIQSALQEQNAKQPVSDKKSNPNIATKEKIVFEKSSQCADCHQEIYDEWKTDQHATAWTEQKYIDFTKNYTRLECLSCHAPEPLLEVGIDSNEPKLRKAHREDGVDCLTCHIKNGETHGTLGTLAVCGGKKEPQLKTSQACYHCHATHNLFKEYRASPQYQQGIQCQDCHMEAVERALVEGGPLRKTRRHRMHAGGHDPEALKKVLEVNATFTKGVAKVKVENVGAAHGVPGEINNRIITMVVAVLIDKQDKDEDGKPFTYVEEVAAFREVFRAPPRFARNRVPSTQIMPGEPKTFEYPLPVKHGKLEIKITYKLEEIELDSEALVIYEQVVPF